MVLLNLFRSLKTSESLVTAWKRMSSTVFRISSYMFLKRKKVILFETPWVIDFSFLRGGVWISSLTFFPQKITVCKLNVNNCHSLVIGQSCYLMFETSVSGWTGPVRAGGNVRARRKEKEQKQEEGKRYGWAEKGSGFGEALLSFVQYGILW